MRGPEDTYRVLVDPQNPDGPAWTVHQYQGRFLFLGPHGPLLFTSNDERNIAAAAGAARAKWLAMPEARRERWFGPRGQYAKHEPCGRCSKARFACPDHTPKKGR